MTYIEKRKILVNKLISDRRIKSKKVEKAFLDTPREFFVPEELKHLAYADAPLEIGNGQTISAPHMVAIMVEALKLDKERKILEIGAGSGYHAAIVSNILSKEAEIYSIETIDSLVKIAKENLKKAKIKNVIVKKGDGKTIIAGYHWFSDWGRDTLISLPGLTLVTSRFYIAKQILNELKKYCKKWFNSKCIH